MSDEIRRKAAAKKKPSKKPSREELRAAHRTKREQQEKVLRDGLAALPKRLYVELSGRQHKVLDEQALRYGLPLLGKSIDLAEVLRCFHDLLRDHGDALSRESAGEDDAGDWGEELKKWKALSAKAEFEEGCRQLLRRSIVETILKRIAALLRGCGERLQHEGHDDAYALLDETLVDAEREIADLLANVPPLTEDLELE